MEDEVGIVTEGASMTRSGAFFGKKCASMTRLEGIDLEPYLGRELLMLKERKLWKVGDVFVVVGNGRNTWHVKQRDAAHDESQAPNDVLLTVNKDLEGVQWKWADTQDPSSFEVREQRLKASHEVPNAIIGREVRMLKDKKSWFSGEVFTVLACQGISCRARNDRTDVHIDAALEGTQWEFIYKVDGETIDDDAVDPDAADGDAVDVSLCTAVQSTSAPGFIDDDIVHQPPMKKPKKLKAFCQPDPELAKHIGRRVRMLKKAKRWSQGDVYTITGIIGQAGNTFQMDGGLTLSPSLCNTQWEWAD